MSTSQHASGEQIRSIRQSTDLGSGPWLAMGNLDVALPAPKRLLLLSIKLSAALQLIEQRAALC
jgi:hypothetical protein